MKRGTLINFFNLVIIHHPTKANDFPANNNSSPQISSGVGLQEGKKKKEKKKTTTKTYL